MAIRGIWNLETRYEQPATLWRGSTSHNTGRLRAVVMIGRRWLAMLRAGGTHGAAAHRLAGGGARSVAEQDAFEQLFTRYQLPLLDYLYGMTRDRAVAEDLVQETFLRAYEAPAPLTQVTHPQAWLYRIATNVALDTTRRQHRFRWLPLSRVEPEAGSDNVWQEPLPPPLRCEDVSASIVERDAIWSMLAELPTRWRAVLLLQTTAGFSVRDIAALLHLEEANIRKMLYRAKERFRAIYAELEAAETGKAQQATGGQP
ncbi:MAG: RNA polymerase sigma factor [Ktedonobacterales bacterium]